MNPLVILMAVVAVASGATVAPPNLSAAVPFIECVSSYSNEVFEDLFPQLQSAVEACFLATNGACTIPTPPPTPAPSSKCINSVQAFNNCSAKFSMVFSNNGPPAAFDYSELWYMKGGLALGKYCTGSSKAAAMKNVSQCINGIPTKKNRKYGIRETLADVLYAVVKKPDVLVCEVISYCNGSYPISNALLNSVRQRLAGCQKGAGNLLGNCGVKPNMQHPFNFACTPACNAMNATLVKKTNIADAAKAAVAAAAAAASSTTADPGTTAVGGTTAADTTAADTTAASTAADTTAAETTTDAPTTTTVI